MFSTARSSGRRTPIAFTADAALLTKCLRVLSRRDDVKELGDRLRRNDERRLKRRLVSWA